MKDHILNNHKTKAERQVGFKYYCEYCDYGTQMLVFSEKHNQTEKHKNIMNILANKV
jgi:uncharacterized protein YutD